MLNVLAMFLSTPGVLPFSLSAIGMPPVVLPEFGAQGFADMLRDRQSGPAPGIIGTLEVRYEQVQEVDLPDLPTYVHLIGRHVGELSGSGMPDEKPQGQDGLWESRAA